MISAEEFFDLLMKNDPDPYKIMEVGEVDFFSCGHYKLAVERISIYAHQISIIVGGETLCVEMKNYDDKYLWISRPPTEIELTKIKLAL